MLHKIPFLLFKLNLRQPSENTIIYWIETKDVIKLEYALKHGNFKTRKLAAEALEHTGQCSSVPVLLQAINDNVQNVSIAALNTLEALGCNDDLAITITKQRFNWVKKLREKEVKQAANKGKKQKIYRWERTSKKNFEIVKERLKRPMR